MAEFKRRSPEMFANIGPAAFGMRVIMVAIIGFVGVLVGVLLLLWQMWHSEE